MELSMIKGAYFVQEANELKLEDEEEERDITYQAKIACDLCGDYFYYTDDVFVLEVAEAAQEYNGAISCMPLTGLDDEYQYAPYVVHVSCYEELKEYIEEAMEDVPPKNAPDPIIRCICCDSEIGQFEPFCAVSFGEIQVSRRCPSGSPTEKIERSGEPDPICVLCLSKVIGDHLDVWDDLLDLLPGGRGQELEEE
jgi:hypothetical protein